MMVTRQDACAPCTPGSAWEVHAVATHLRRLLQHLILCLVLLPAALHEQLQAALPLPLVLRVEGVPNLRGWQQAAWRASGFGQ